MIQEGNCLPEFYGVQPLVPQLRWAGGFYRIFFVIPVASQFNCCIFEKTYSNTVLRCRPLHFL